MNFDFNDSMPDFGGDYDAAPIGAPVLTWISAPARAARFPCRSCGGSGRKFRGTCYACNGRGHFLSSDADRAKARTSRAASKARDLTEARTLFDTQYPGMAAWIDANASWNDF